MKWDIFSQTASAKNFFGGGGGGGVGGGKVDS